MSKPNEPRPQGRTGRLGERLRREVRGYAESLAVAFLVVTFLFNTVGVVGASMEPTLDGGPGSRDVLASILTGDRVFIPKYDTWLRRAGFFGPYERGEIVVLRQPENAPHTQLTGDRPFVIKRIVAVPGDTLRIEAGRVHVNGRPLDPSFITASGEVAVAPVDFPVVTQRAGKVAGLATRFADAGGTAVPTHTRTGAYPPAMPIADPRVQLYYGETLDALAPIPAGATEGEPFVHELVVPEDRYFVMGDNRSAGGSEDSRLYGLVPARTIAGRAAAVLWPPRRDGAWNWRRLEPPETFSGRPIPTPRR